MKTRTCWNFPPDLAGLFGLYGTIVPIAIMNSLFFPILTGAKKDGGMTQLWIAIALGCVGTTLLFLARLPLYRAGRFTQVGPRGLDETHLRLYRWAWRFIGACIGWIALLLVVLG